MRLGVYLPLNYSQSLVCPGSWHLRMDHLIDSAYYYKESHDVLLLTRSCGGNILGSQNAEGQIEWSIHKHMKDCSVTRKMHNKTYDQRIEVVEEALEALPSGYNGSIRLFVTSQRVTESHAQMWFNNTIKRVNARKNFFNMRSRNRVRI